MASDIPQPALPQGQRAKVSGTRRSFPAVRAIMALMLREMSTRYGRSPGGYLWALLEPLAGILILSLGFSLIARTPPLGNSFILFFATGFLPFLYYSNLSSDIGRCIKFSKALLFYPSVTWVDAALARLILVTLTDVLVMILLFTGLILAAGIHVDLSAGPIILAVALTGLMSFGLGLINCMLFGLYPVWMQIWGIVNRPMFLISGAFFLYEDMPRVAQDYLWYNPLIHITGLMRQGFYTSYTAEYVSVSYVLVFSIVAIFFGSMLLRRHHRTILNA